MSLEVEIVIAVDATLARKTAKWDQECCLRSDKCLFVG